MNLEPSLCLYCVFYINLTEGSREKNRSSRHMDVRSMGKGDRFCALQGNYESDCAGCLRNLFVRLSVYSSLYKAWLGGPTSK